MCSGGRKNGITYFDFELLGYHFSRIPFWCADDRNVALPVRHLASIKDMKYTTLTYGDNSTKETAGYSFDLIFYLLFG
jgi:hypothetical protein